MKRLLVLAVLALAGCVSPKVETKFVYLDRPAAEEEALRQGRAALEQAAADIVANLDGLKIAGVRAARQQVLVGLATLKAFVPTKEHRDRAAALSAKIIAETLPDNVTGIHPDAQAQIDAMDALMVKADKDRRDQAAEAERELKLERERRAQDRIDARAALYRWVGAIFGVLAVIAFVIKARGTGWTLLTFSGVAFAASALAGSDFVRWVIIALVSGLVVMAGIHLYRRFRPSKTIQ